ncbi:serine hydrolase domain-containing protein [Sphingomonas lenta]|uniref:Serine hydrolase n=1 Tax=Sphingomonas lenta TaxID=1141887 RepID=A0A2A2SJE0_9SPHN|nr:serine hydrolase domain-containing protein [Sphingomonas lenta]PAX09352.1 serine hydrolase [Sphingomonas lenta]
MNPYRLALALPLAFLAAPALAQQLSPEEAAAVDRLVTMTLADTGVPSASVAIVRGGETVFTKAYGKQSERAGAADAKAIYPIASISKQFVAAVLQQLENEGKLSLDDRVAKYVPDVSGADRITIRQLLAHTSGLQDYWPQDYSFAAMSTATKPQGIIDRWGKKPLDFEPGAQWQYSNTGYVVAGQIASKVTGKPIVQLMQERLLKPLGIRAVDQDDAVGPGHPQGYQRFALGPVRLEPPAARGWLYAAGDLAMSAGDLAKWNIARLNRAAPLTPDDWAEQETPVKLTNGESSGYGLGVVAGNRDGRRTIEHSGGAVGFLLQNMVFPDQKAAVTVLTNGSFSDTSTRIATGLARVVLPPTNAEDAAVLTAARTLFDQLRRGQPDAGRLTENARFYFTPAALADYRQSLSALGEPTSFTQAGRASLRGGFVQRRFRVTYPNRTLAISTFAEPGSNGRWEQFMVSPTQ